MPTSSHNTPEKRSRSGPIASLIVVAVLVLYPLSSGPALVAFELGWIPPEVVVGYKPIEWLASRSNVVGSAVEQYWGWWVWLANCYFTED